MAKIVKSAIQSQNSNLPPEVLNLLGKPPLASGEDPAIYYQNITATAEFIKPRNHLEWTLVKDYVDDTWLIARLRRLQARLGDVAKKEALTLVMQTITHDGLPVTQSPMPGHEAASLAAAWFENTASKETAQTKLSQHGLDAESITAQAIALQSHDLEAIDRMIGSAMCRRAGSLREIENLRDTFGMTLPKVVEV